MARPPSSKAFRLSAEESQLEQLHAENLRQQQELRKKLIRIPAQIAAQKEQKRREDRERAESAGRAISSGRGRGRSKRSQEKGRSYELPSRVLFSVQIKTAILLTALAGIFFLLWHAVPSK